MPNFLSQFYSASIICALEHMHQNNIIYRDLKPENVMITWKGDLIVLDLGTCKILNPSDGFRTYTLIGTPHYMAP